MAAFFIVRRNRYANRVFRSRIDNYIGLNVNTEALGEEELMKRYRVNRKLFNRLVAAYGASAWGKKTDRSNAILNSVQVISYWKH